MYDVVIIGCGIVGSATAYELSRYNLKVAVLEKFNDVANGVTKANSAILHAGFDCPPGTMEAQMNLEGIKLAKELCEKLDVERREIPTFVLAFDQREIGEINMLYDRGIKNGVEGLRILTREETLALEPNINPNIIASLYAPYSGIINPWEYAIALAETAVRNGAEVHLGTRVTAIKKEQEHFVLTTPKGEFTSRYVVNAAGPDSDLVHEMIGGSGFKSTRFRGQYYVLDKSQGNLINSVIFPCPDEHGFKGVLVSPTVHGNLIVGPDSDQVPDSTEVGSVGSNLKQLKLDGLRSVPGINFRESIRNYAGIRPNTEHHDFIIGESKAAKGFINLAGIKSPGLSAAPSIAKKGVEVLESCGLKLEKKEHFIDTRKRTKLSHLSPEERAKLISENPLFGRVICRCETVTEGEIVEAIHRPIVPMTIDAIKRRCRAGMGRCQGGFCGPKVHEILARELNVPYEDILMDEEGTYILTGPTKEGAEQ